MKLPGPGDFFERYYLASLLGQGGMSQVYLGYDLLEPRLVAVKFLDPILAQNPKVVARMRREAEIYRVLRHPAIVSVLAGGIEPGKPIYLVLTLLRGHPLDGLVAARGGRLAAPEAVKVLEDAAGALSVAHRRGVIHQDVKPQNLVVDADGRATLIDFGIAHAQDEFQEAIQGGVAGTLAYSSPEQRRGEEPDSRSDIFSLGCVLYELLTGRRALPGGSFKDLVGFRTASLPAPSALVPGIPPELDAICRRLMADLPEARYQDLTKLLVELGHLRLQLEEPARTALFGPPGFRDLDAGWRALREGRMSEADGTAAALVEHIPLDLAAPVHRFHARVLTETGRPGEALQAYARALAAEPGSVDAVLDLALLQLRMGRIDAAARTLVQAPGSARDHHLVAGLAEVVRALPEVPPPILARFTYQDQGRQLQRAIRALVEAEAAGSG